MFVCVFVSVSVFGFVLMFGFEFVFVLVGRLFVVRFLMRWLSRVSMVGYCLIRIGVRLWDSVMDLW